MSLSVSVCLLHSCIVSKRLKYRQSSLRHTSSLRPSGVTQIQWGTHSAGAIHARISSAYIDTGSLSRSSSNADAARRCCPATQMLHNHLHSLIIHFPLLASANHRCRASCLSCQSIRVASLCLHFSSGSYPLTVTCEARVFVAASRLQRVEYVIISRVSHPCP